MHANLCIFLIFVNCTSFQRSALALAAGGNNSRAQQLKAFPPSAAVWKSASGDWNTPIFSATDIWEHSAVQEPQVIFLPEKKILRMWYRGAGWGAPSGVGVADSLDGGMTWTKHKYNPVWTEPENVCAGQPWVFRESTGRFVCV